MSALPKEIVPVIPEDEDYGEDEWSEDDSQETDALAEAVARMERREQDLRDAVQELKSKCEEMHRRRMRAWEGKLDMRMVERAVCAEIAAAATVGGLEHITQMKDALEEIAQLEADHECARQIEYQLRFGSPPAV